jgi:hypothetical protein
MEIVVCWNAHFDGCICLRSRILPDSLLRCLLFRILVYADDRRTAPRLPFRPPLLLFPPSPPVLSSFVASRCPSSSSSSPPRAKTKKPSAAKLRQGCKWKGERRDSRRNEPRHGESAQRQRTHRVRRCVPACACRGPHVNQWPFVRLRVRRPRVAQFQGGFIIHPVRWDTCNSGRGGLTGAAQAALDGALGLSTLCCARRR